MNSVPQTAVTTFAFASVIILPLYTGFSSNLMIVQKPGCQIDNECPDSYNCDISQICIKWVKEGDSQQGNTKNQKKVPEERHR